ncbi:MAG: hypothetical protein KIT59_00800 [Nitrosomonas sp.]|nr:hypothetical protein [Nitrosomonas sp.]
MTDKNNVITLVNSQENTALQQFEIDIHNAIMKATDSGVSLISIIGLMQCHINIEASLLLRPNLID